MSLSKKIFIDKVCAIREDEKTKRTIILVENGEHEIELSIATKQLSRIMGYMTVKRFEAFVAKIKNTRSLSRRTA